MDEEQYQKRYFDAVAHQYPRAAVLQPPTHTALEIRALLDRLCASAVDAPIVDFGCGTGRLSIALARAGYSVLAIDVSDSSLKTLSGIASELGLPAIRTGSALPLRERFSAVVGADILHHVDLNLYLPRIRDSLSAGGKAIFSEPGALNPWWYIYLPLFHDMRVEKRIVSCNIRTLRRKFEEHGFRDVRVTGLGLLRRALFRLSVRACQWHDPWVSGPS